ncbi:MAG TPA: FAD-dependent oxidoreductase [Hyphomicrobiaceae bacterium]|nr:FAD-dependent oxidoreductase [Hyphomicrobiaceae bacterium]
MPGPFPHLFEPIRLGRQDAKNRVMRVATTANLADRNQVGPRLLEFYRTLAKGGVGTIVTEALRTQPDDPFGPGALVVFDRRGVDGLRRLSDVCHAEGALLIGQLNMGGRQHLASRVVPFMIAPSAIACPRSGGVPHELSTREVGEIIETYVMCAVHCIEGGMDGVEIHGAQGHLIQQFLSPFSNRRTDQYGGTAENRLRFAREILEGVRRRIGQRPIVGFRLGVEEFTEGGLTIDDTVEIGRQLCADGLVDYLSLAQGNFNSIEAHLPDRHWPLLAYRSLHARFKPVANGVPVVLSTRIQGPEQAESVLAAGEADMIGLCRALLVDPDWPMKARTGKADEIRRCIACNQCWAWISTGEPIACATNPMTGREHLWPKPERDRVETPHHVVVVGGGPAGLEAARVAALRGNRVTLLERENELGGRVRAAQHVKHHEEMRNLLDYLVPQVRKAGVDIRTGVNATAESILAEAPDEVILATGATPYAPALDGDGSVPVSTADGPVDLAGRAGRRVVIMDEDGYYWTTAVAESVMAQGREPVIVTRFFEIAREVPMVSRIAFLRELDRNGGSATPNHYVARASNGGVVLRHYLTEREEVIDDVAAVVWVGPATPNFALAEELRAAGLEATRLRVVGDAFQPRRLANALVEAHAAARAIGTRARL